MTRRSSRDLLSVLQALGLALALTNNASCSSPRNDAHEADKADFIADSSNESATKAESESVVAEGGDTARALLVTAANRARLGLATAPLPAAEEIGQTEGVGLVISAEPLAQLDAELAAARTAATASHAAQARAEALYADQVSVSLAVVEEARHQAANDVGQVAWTERRLALEWGPRTAGSPFGNDSSRRLWLDRLTSGRAALVRVQFPLGTALRSRTPILHLESLTAGSPDSRSGAARVVWPAPEDPNLPGPAFLALVDGGGLPQIGERLRARADDLHRQRGVRIPESAVVLSGGSAWVYVEVAEVGGATPPAPSRFVRRAIPVSSLSRSGAGQAAVGDGYFVASGFSAGEHVVTQGAGLLLAQEIGAGSSGADEED